MIHQVSGIEQHINRRGDAEKQKEITGTKGDRKANEARGREMEIERE